MLRDKSIIPLSHHHQHALALCVRIDRAIQAGEVELDPWQAEIQQIFEQEISVHFAAEEKELFPAAEKFPELRPLVAELRVEHALLRQLFAKAAERSFDQADLQRFAARLSGHVRKEERQLFQEMQARMSAEDFEELGAKLEPILAQASEVCFLPNEATRLRGKK
jgi:hemerythrin-like domain-containing protein